MEFRLHDTETAPAAAREALAKREAALGMIPNLFRLFAGAPALLEGYARVADAFERSGLDPVSRYVVWIAASVELDGPYDVAGHTTLARSKAGVPENVLAALREGGEVPDARLDALARFVRALVRTRGRVDADTRGAFLAAGYTEAHALEVVVGAGQKMLSVLACNLADLPLDDVFADDRWTLS